LTGRVSVVEKREFPVLAYNYPWRALLWMLDDRQFYGDFRTLNVDISSRKTICTEETDVCVFDMDSQLIQTEVIDELADRAGVEKR
jgi:phosphoserine phosphatase